MKKPGLLFIVAAFIFSCEENFKEQRASDRGEYSPYVGDYEATPLPDDYDKPLWGDTHLHTSYSVDAGMLGNTLGPDAAYRFAKGEEVITSHNLPIRLIRPLDFLVVADHAENLGLAPLIAESNEELLKTEFGKKLHDLVKSGKGHEAFQTYLAESATKNDDKIDNSSVMRTAWDREIDLAEKHNEPGNFTALIGFEWSSLATMDKPGNLHRVVIFKDGIEKAGQVVPFSTFDSNDPEDLWKYLVNYEETTGGNVLAIGHNGNLSNGLMFPLERFNGEPLDLNYVTMRERFEPLYEVTQIKGDGEAHPVMSPNDEFADYGNWDKSDIMGMIPKENWMLTQEYARSALQLGLQLEDKLGVNPFKFGMIGSTDAHTSLATTREENFYGKAPHLEPDSSRWKHVLIGSIVGDEKLSSYSYETIGAGLAAVWSKENTREGIYDAMKNKETYATTGTRIIVRFFGGYDFQESDLGENLVKNGYEKGVPMGGDLTTAEGKTPTFTVRSSKDPDGANLDRMQMIKGWIDAKGERQERIYDLAVSDDRVIAEDGRCKTPVGNTVDVVNASYTNDIGDSAFETVWKDPDFDPSLRAFYYIRVLEIPTPTWQAYDSKYYGVKMDEKVEMMAQERAYTSPIWYTPKSK
ncbi:MAG: DUF3604 domain-containing protein [Reichenbachiella sp.]